MVKPSTIERRYVARMIDRLYLEIPADCVSVIPAKGDELTWQGKIYVVRIVELDEIAAFASEPGSYRLLLVPKVVS